MQLDRRTRKDPATGEEVKNARFTLRFTDHQGKRRSIALFTRRAPSEAWARRLIELVNARAGGEALAPGARSWVEQLPARVLERLILWRVLDPRKIASTIPIGEHLQKWRRALEASGVDPLHIQNTSSRVEVTLNKCGIGRWSEIRPLDIQHWLASQTGEAPLWASRTHDSYVQSLKQFCRWMVANEFAMSDPLVNLKIRGAGRSEARRNRRAITIEEARALVHSAENSTRRVEGVEPATRALLYRIALQTGLRLSEVARLRVGAIRWGGEHQPFTTLRPKVTETKAGRKTGRQDEIPVRAELEEHLRRAVHGCDVQAYLLPGLWSPSAKGGRGAPKSGAKMIRADLLGTGIPYVDDLGEVLDFHSLRHTYSTLNGASGMDGTTAMALNRHADLKTTSGYMHVRMGGLLAALEQVPGLDEPEPDPESLPKEDCDESLVPSTVPSGSEFGVTRREVIPTLAPPDGTQVAFLNGFQISRFGVRITAALPLSYPTRPWGRSGLPVDAPLVSRASGPQLHSSAA